VIRRKLAAIGASAQVGALVVTLASAALADSHTPPPIPPAPSLDTPLRASFFGDAVGVPLPRDVRSVLVMRREEPIYSEPSTRGGKRGAAILGAHLPLFGVRRGPGCAGRWFHVGPHAFICEDGAELSAAMPLALGSPEIPTQHGLPYDYHFVSPDGSFGYTELDSAELGVPNAQLQPGFGIAVERVVERTRGDAFGLTSRGFWVPMRDLRPARVVTYEGSTFTPDLAWVIREAATTYASPGGTRRSPPLQRLTAVRVLEEVERGGVRYARVGEGAWLRMSDLVKPSESPPPAELRPGERWIDIDLRRQTLVAYAGATPWFATLTSTGRGPARSESATPEGNYRIWVKLRTSDMDNLENIEAVENYAIEAVPWVMFFHRGYGLHGTFWHQRFGEVRSHGCVNLAPRDAERLFHWTQPKLPPGWSAVFPYAHETGTLVRVRR
ncbi:MAG TPA: L,D-transpeptidase, partial [Polyangiaceae bacterium]